MTAALATAEVETDTIRILVCTQCRAPGGDPDAPRPGAQLHSALAMALERDEALAARLKIEPVECLSVCKRPCTVGIQGADRWTYIYGDFDAEMSVETLLAFAEQYRATSDGIVPWRERPDIIRKGVIARVPPLR
jgi:predicted metal-binding protein